MGNFKLRQVNLIPEESIKKPFLKKLKAFAKENKKLVRSIVFGILFISGLLAAPFIIVNNYESRVDVTKSDVNNMKTKFKKLQSQSFQFEKLKTDLKKKEAAAKQRLSMLLSTSSKENGYSELLLTIASLLPEDLWINRFLMNDSEIQITGTALDSSLVADLMNKLEACKSIKNSRFISSEKQTVESHMLYNFQITTEPGWSQKQVSTVKESSEKEKNKTNNKNGR